MPRERTETAALSQAEVAMYPLLLLLRVLLALSVLGPAAAFAALPADTLRCVAYAPTHFDPGLGIFPDDASILADLAVLRAEGCRCLTTYASDGTLGRIPRLAREAGFECVYMGVYCPSGRAEIDSAIAARAWVDGYVVGNEGLGEVRSFCPYDSTELQEAMDELRAATGKPVTTCEQIDDYLAGPFATWLLAHGDWMFPNAHPFWAGERRPQPAVDWTLGKFESLAARTAKPVLLRETGLPTAGCDECSEAAQDSFFQLLSRTRARHCFFEAFDQTWKNGNAVEKHWGINRADRQPKQIGIRLPVALTSWGQAKRRYRRQRARGARRWRSPGARAPANARLTTLV